MHRSARDSRAGGAGASEAEEEEERSESEQRTRFGMRHRVSDSHEQERSKAANKPVAHTDHTDDLDP